MGRLKHITFTGINIYRDSDLQLLCYLQERFPLAEFGILCSEDWSENGPRFMAPYNFHLLVGKGLNLSAHLCGTLAKEAAKGNWYPFEKYCDGYHPMFNRIQLNLSSQKPTTENTKVEPPRGVEVIIQSKNLMDYSIFSEMICRYSTMNKISMLVDASGGRGKLLDWLDLREQIIHTPIDLTKYKVGYAGGLDVYTVTPLIYNLCKINKVGDFWIDMESSLRCKDNPIEFDFGKVEYICKEVNRVLNSVLCDEILETPKDNLYE